MRYVSCLALMLFVLLPSSAPAQVYGDNNSLVDSWYRTYLGRAPDPGMAGWVAQLNQGIPADSVLGSILGSDEFYTRAGSTPQGYVTLLYNDILQRPPTPAELSYWMQRMYTTDRAGIAVALLTQHSGVWVGARPAVTSPVVVAPPVVTSVPRWERDRHWDWARHHDIHEYHRPVYPFHHEEHHR